MSSSLSLPPRSPEQLAFLPHPHSFRTPPSSSYPELPDLPRYPIASRPRAATALIDGSSGNNPQTWVRSAPTSPSGRHSFAGALGMSMISPISLDPPGNLSTSPKSNGGYIAPANIQRVASADQVRNIQSTSTSSTSMGPNTSTSTGSGSGYRPPRSQPLSSNGGLGLNLSEPGVQDRGMSRSTTATAQVTVSPQQQLARHQAAAARVAPQSYFPPVASAQSLNLATPVQVPIQGQRPPSSQPPYHSQIQAGPIAPTPSRLSSTNVRALQAESSSGPGLAKPRSRSRRRTNGNSDSGEETERGFESDATVMDHRRIGKASYSQTDLPELKRRLSQPKTGQQGNQPHRASGEGSLAGVGAGYGKFRDTDTITLPRPLPLAGRRTPPTRPAPLTAQTVPIPAAELSILPLETAKSPRSKSTLALTSLRRSPTTSPRHSTASLRRSPHASPRDGPALLPLTPVTPRLSPKLKGRALDELSSGDADGEFGSETDTSISFTAKTSSSYLYRRRISPPNSRGRKSSPIRNAIAAGGGTMTATAAADTDVKSLAEIDQGADTFVKRYTVLRSLAVVPACWGIGVLISGLWTGGVWYDVWPWGVDFSREALYRLKQGGEHQGDWRRSVRGDLILAIAWAALTGHFCFRFTTGLAYRWRSYYNLFPVLVRLVSLQALCWPATYLPLWFLGPSQPLFAWAVIGVSTGITYAVIMWLASNVMPDFDDESGDEWDDEGDGDGDADRGVGRRYSTTDGDHTPKLRSRSLPSGSHRDGRRSRRRMALYQQPFPAFSSPLPLGHHKTPPEAPAHLSWWEKLNYRRRWDWDLVAREVGWKVGAMLMVTLAWVFVAGTGGIIGPNQRWGPSVLHHGDTL